MIKFFEFLNFKSLHSCSHSKDLNTLRCQEQRLTKLADMIKNALNELGCEELPSGCDDLSVEQAFIDANVEQTVRESIERSL